MSKTFAVVFARAATEKTVCEICELSRLGHAPESRWLGFKSHSYTPRNANDVDMIRARELTELAYSLKD